MNQVRVAHDETDFDAGNQTDAFINPIKQYYTHHDDKKSQGFVKQPAFSQFRNNKYSPQIDLGTASQFGMPLQQITKQEFQFLLKAQDDTFGSRNQIQSSSLAESFEEYEEDAMEMMTSEFETEAINSLIKIYREHITLHLLFRQQMKNRQIITNFNHGEIMYDPIEGQQLYFPNKETVQSLVDLIFISENEFEERLVEEFDIANINKDYVLDNTEISEFINNMLNYIEYTTGLNYPRIQVTDTMTIQRIMFELNKFTSPNKYDNDNFAQIEVGPEHEGITLVKIRRALQILKENIQHTLLENDDEEQKMKLICCWSYTLTSIAIIIIIIVCCVVLICNPTSWRSSLNTQTGFLTDHFQRQVIDQRIDYDQQLMKYRLSYYDDNAIIWSSCEVDPYWGDDSQITISLKAEKEIMEATYQLHSMVLEAVEKVVNSDTLLTMFNINEDLWPIIKKSWQNKQMDFQGRFDFSWDGQNPPKMLEYNGDTPSMTIESSVVQADWFNDRYSDQNFTQSNMMSALIDQTFIQINKNCYKNPGDVMGMVTINEDQEMTAQMAFFNDKFNALFPRQKNLLVDINNMKLGYKDDCSPVLRVSASEVKCVLNVYPKEWIITEIDKDDLLKWDFQNLNFIEPPWKLILSNKAILPLLWEMFPNHPNLVPAYYDSPAKQFKSDSFKQISQDWISKPLFGREGAGILQSNNFSSYQEFEKETENLFLKDGQKLGKSIYQAYWKLPEIQGRVIQLSTWVIGGQPASIMFRQGKGGSIFQNASPFVPHVVSGSSDLRPGFIYTHTARQKEIRQNLYQDQIKPTQDFPTEFNQINSLPKSSQGVSESFLVAVSNWLSFKDSQAQAAQKTENQKKYDDKTINEARQAKCKIEGTTSTQRKLQSTLNQFMTNNPGFSTKTRGQRFGSTARNINALSDPGNPFSKNWYSVDRQGNVRVYNYMSSPYYWYYSRSFYTLSTSYRASYNGGGRTSAS